jgi:hypothetical protein
MTVQKDSTMKPKDKDMENQATVDHESAGGMSDFKRPAMLAALKEQIFEGLANDLAMKWSLRFASAIQPGQDLSMVGPRFLLWLLRDSDIPGRDDPVVKPAFDACVAVIADWCDGKLNGTAAAEAARAARATEAEAWAWAAWAATAARAATWAARAAEAAAATSAAAWAASAAWAAARAAWAASAASADGQPDAYSRMAEHLLRLIAEAPMGDSKRCS